MPDLKSLRLAVGEEGNGTQILTMQLLEQKGVMKIRMIDIRSNVIFLIIVLFIFSPDLIAGVCPTRISSSPGLKRVPAKGSISLPPRQLPV
jgi:hypothetical protein